jgi:hypothetical protein
MKCPRCNGKRCEPNNSGYLVWIACKMCHGTGIVPDNNENWFCSLPTEEKAKWLADNFGYVAYKGSGGKPKRVQEDLVEYWQEWLKEEHK